MVVSASLWRRRACRAGGTHRSIDAVLGRGIPKSGVCKIAHRRVWSGHRCVVGDGWNDNSGGGVEPVRPGLLVQDGNTNREWRKDGSPSACGRTPKPPLRHKSAGREPLERTVGRRAYQRSRSLRRRTGDRSHPGRRRTHRHDPFRHCAGEGHRRRRQWQAAGKLFLRLRNLRAPRSMECDKRVALLLGEQSGA